MRTLRSLTVGIALLAVAACGGSDPSGPADDRGLPSTLTVGIIPNVAPDQQSAKYEPLRAYLAEALDVTVKLFVATDYAGVVAALAAGTVDAAYVGGLTYLQAAEQVDVVPLVTEIDRETGTTEYYSGIVVRADAPYDTLGEVLAAKGRFAFGDVSSTSGSAYPRIMLAEAGAECSTTVMDRCPPLSGISFTGGHDATAQAVLNGSADAGGLEVRIMHRLERDGHLPEDGLKVVEKVLVMGYPWIMRSDVGAPAAEALTTAFLEMDRADLLDLMGTTGYAEVGPADYAELKQYAEDLGLLNAGR